MGYPVTRFTDTVDQNLICSICSCVLEEAVLTVCGHSFCQLCLHTWIQARGAGPPTCPECRSGISGADQSRPILSIRNLVSNMETYCDYRPRGCRVIVKLEGLKTHLEVCSYTPIECAGCNESVNRSELAEHHMTCDVIAAALRDEDELLQTALNGSFLNSSAGSNSATSSAISVFNLGMSREGARLSQSKDNMRSTRLSSGDTYRQLAELACRSASLELKLTRMKRDLEKAEEKNKKLEAELKQTRDELKLKSRIENSNYSNNNNTHHSVHNLDFDPDYEYGFTPSSISRLSCLLGKFLLRKPSYICRDRVFTAIKRCYDNYARSGDRYEHDVHMLVATSYASNWFSDTQKLHFYLWLQSISRRGPLQNSSNNRNNLSIASVRGKTR